MNNDQLLAKIRELSPDADVTIAPDIPHDIVRLFLIFIARAQRTMVTLYTGFHVKSCKYLTRPFYRLSLVYRSSQHYPHPHHYPHLNVDAETLNMFHAAGKVARCNLEQQDYVHFGFHWFERRNKLNSQQDLDLDDAFVWQHGLE